MHSGTTRAGGVIAAYSVIAALGAGGTGEVWRAGDTRLGRTVGVKPLPSEFAVDSPDGGWDRELDGGRRR